MTFPPVRVLLVFAIAWTALLASLYAWTTSRVGMPTDPHGPTEFSAMVALVITLPLGYLAAYLLAWSYDWLGWPGTPIAQLRALWLLAGTLGFVQWALAPVLVGAVIERLWPTRGGSLANELHKTPADD